MDPWVLDGSAKPMERIWCLYEVGPAKKFNKAFQIIINDGDLSNTSNKMIEEISKNFFKLRACYANTSRDSDKLAIQYRILDLVFRSMFISFEIFKMVMADDSDNDKVIFEEFDAHICSLTRIPILTSGFKVKSKTAYMRAIWMGAEVTVAYLKELTQHIGADLNKKERI